MFHVADDAVAVLLRGVGHTVDSHVDHHGAVLHHVGGDELRLADGHHQYIGLAGNLRQVLRLAVAHGDGAVETLTAQQVGGGRTHNVRAANHHAVLAGGLDAIALQQRADAHRRGGHKALLAQHHAADVDGRETIHILVGRDGVDDLLLVDMLRQGELHDETVDVGVVVEEFNGLQKLGLGGLVAHAVDTGGEPHLVARLLLVGDVGHARPVLAHDYCGQMRCAVPLLGQLAHLVGYFVFDLQGHRLAVQ